jgi:MSHA biogenesis protein MshM
MASLDDTFVTAFVQNPALQPRSLMLAVADELEIKNEKYVDQHKLLKSIYYKLVELAREHKKVLLCIDEAQAMPLETMEALRLLTNLETEKRKLMQIVLFGQPELNRKLEEPSIRQLTQRITFHYDLGPLSVSELDDYIAHRLAVAGYDREHRLFTERAIRKLHRTSGGIPRLANILAHKAMLVAFGQGTRDITPKHVKAASDDTLASTLRKPNRLWPLGALTLSIVSVLGVAWAFLK